MGPPPLIVSVHLPKTAGTSLAAALAGAFGEGFSRDYGDLPLHAHPLRRHLAALRAGRGPSAAQGLAGCACVHGHFLPLKYLPVAAYRPLRFVTWMRHPLDRLRSHYDFWRRSYRPATAGRLHRIMMREDWSFETFAFHPALRNVYSQFLWRFPLDRFEFIGITEAYGEELDELSRRLDRDLLPGRVNAASGRESPGPVRGSRLWLRLERWHDGDMRLYRSALARRRAR